MNDRRVVVAVGTGIVTFIGAKFGVLKQIPTIGPVPAAVVTIGLGLAIVAFLDRPGTLGAGIEGAGYGLIAVGALELAGA